MLIFYLILFNGNEKNWLSISTPSQTIFENVKSNFSRELEQSLFTSFLLKALVQSIALTAHQSGVWKTNTPKRFAWMREWAFSVAWMRENGEKIVWMRESRIFAWTWKFIFLLRDCMNFQIYLRECMKQFAQNTALF